MKVKTANISEVAEVNPRLPSTLAAEKERSVDFVPMSQLSECGRIETNGVRPLGEVSKGYNYFANGDVIVAKITPCMENGKAAFVQNLPCGIAFGSTEFHVLRPFSNLDGRYLFYMIWNPLFRQAAEVNMTGSAGQKRVPKKFFDRYTIPLPPLSEQKRIADILDKADAIRRKRQQAIDVHYALRASLFDDMFSSQLSTAKWTTLSEYLEELRYGTSNKASDDGYVTLRIPNIVGGTIDTSDLKTVAVSDTEFEKLKLVDGDVLFVRTNGNPDYVGRCAVYDSADMEAVGLSADQMIYASYLIRGRLCQKQIRPTFLQSLLQTSSGRKDVREKCRTSAGQYNINTKGLGSLRVPQVPIRDQIEFEKRVDALRPSSTKLVDALTESDDLFNSLVQRAFKGEL